MNFVEEHFAGLHQKEIVEIMVAMHPALVGHQRIISCFALTRMLAVMLGPARLDTREGYLRELVPMLQAILTKMDEMSEPTPSADDERETS